MTDGDAASARQRAAGARWPPAALLVLLALAVAPWWVPSPTDGPILCPSRAFFAFECAGCGLSRSWTALVRGDLTASASAHPLGPALYLLACTALVATIARWTGRPRAGSDHLVPRRPWVAALVAVLAAGFVAVGATRAWATLT